MLSNDGGDARTGAPPDAPDDGQRLVGCFAQVFPRLTEAQIRAASMKTLGAASDMPPNGQDAGLAA